MQEVVGLFEFRTYRMRTLYEGTNAAPQVQSVVVNDGSPQRSMVTSLTVTFSTVVHFLSLGFVPVAGQKLSPAKAALCRECPNLTSGQRRPAHNGLARRREIGRIGKSHGAAPLVAFQDRIVPPRAVLDDDRQGPARKGAHCTFAKAWRCYESLANLRLAVGPTPRRSTLGPTSSSHQCYRLRVAAATVIIAAMSEVTRILEAIGQGDTQAAEQLLPLVYEELRRLAKQKLAHEKPGQTLQATALVHEAYLRLVASTGGNSEESQQHWNSRGHFFAAAAEAIRRILVEDARRKRRIKHGGAFRRAELADLPAPTADDRLLALDDALKKLGEEDPVAARVVELRHFAGFGHEQIATVLGITIYHARQKWAYARAWLRDALGD